MAVYNLSCTKAIMAALLLLPACSASDGRFPSLERRPFETQTPVATPAPAAPAALPEALASKVQALIARHQSANTSFIAGLLAMHVTAAGAAGSPPGSESWVNAHLQLSRLDKTRADSVAALGELDGLIAEQIDGDSVYVSLLVEYQQQVATEVAAQRGEIDGMSRQIGE